MKNISRVSLFRFWRQFLAPYHRVLLILVFLNMLPGALLSLRPLVLAPVLGKVLPGDIVAAQSLSTLTLDNLGVTLQQWLGGSGADLAVAFIMSGCLYLLLTVLVATIGGGVTLWSMSIRLKILKDMINALHSHLMGLHLGFFHQQRTGDLISRFSTDLTKTAGSFEVIFSGVMKCTVQLLVYALILFHSDPVLTMEVLSVGLIHVLISYFLGKKVKKFTTVVYDGLAALTAALQESFQNVRIIKSFSAECFDSRKIEIEAENVRVQYYRFMFARYLEEPIRLVADAVVTAAILYISYQAIADKRMTMAGIALFFYMASQLVVPVSELSRHILGIYGVYGGFVRLMELFATETTMPDGTQKVENFNDSLSLDGVCYSYGTTPVLHEISLTIKKGETVGVVGASGSGKSTLIDLLLRLADPVAGTVRCDSIALTKLQQDSYRKMFGIVSQECLLFNSTLQDNIVLGRPYDQDDLARACEIANALEFIDELPEGLQTHVGDRGIRLSGGQRQRIAIARAVYSRPQILILDEATSALDTISERKVQKAITKAIEGVTAIIVAHRLSTIVHADKIVVLSNGVIEAMGTHQELLRNSESYKELSQYQISGTG